MSTARASPGSCVDHYEPVDILFRLAERSSIVVLNGGGFAGPQWSLRVSLANLPDEAYGEIGRHVETAAADYTRAWKAATAGRREMTPEQKPRRQPRPKPDERARPGRSGKR